MCAVFFNVSIPAGAMLERAPDGTIEVTICSAQGMFNAWLNLETGQLVKQDDLDSQDDTDSPEQCPMASPSPLASSNAALEIFTVTRIAQPFRTEMSGVKLVIGQTPARLSARGPPTIT